MSHLLDPSGPGPSISVPAQATLCGDGDASTGIDDVGQRVGSRELAATELVRILARQPTVAAAAFFDRQPTGELAPVTPLVCRSAATPHAANWEPQLVRAVSIAAVECEIQSTELVSNAQTNSGVVIPVVVEGVVSSAVCVVAEAGSAANAGLMTLALQAAKEVSTWKTKPSFQSSPEPPHSMRRTCDTRLIVRMTEQPDMTGGCQVLSDRLLEKFNAAHVFVGVVRNGRRCRLTSMSPTQDFKRNSPLVTSVEAALDEAMLFDAWQACDVAVGGGVTTNACKELSGLCQTHRFISGPLLDEHERRVGAIVILANHPLETPLLQLVDQAERGESPQWTTDFASCITLLSRLQPSWVHRGWDRLARSGRARPRTISLVVAVLLALGCLPLPYQVKCDVTIEASTRRYLPVPMDGVLSAVMVEPGDEVTDGQVLARMDRREVEWELSSLTAELGRAGKQRDTGLAQNDTAAAQLAELEMRRLQSRHEMLAHRLENTEIRSPIDGVVVGGDLKKKVGARLTTGQNLFEIGLLDDVVAEVLIPDDEIARSAVGQSVRLRLDAYPSRLQQGEIRHIHPQAEQREQKNVFVAEVELANRHHLLRPGMKGRAKVRSTMRPLAWNLFRKPIESVFYWLGW